MGCKSDARKLLLELLEEPEVISAVKKSLGLLNRWEPEEDRIIGKAEVERLLQSEKTLEVLKEKARSLETELAQCQTEKETLQHKIQKLMEEKAGNDAILQTQAEQRNGRIRQLEAELARLQRDNTELNQQASRNAAEYCAVKSRLQPFLTIETAYAVFLKLSKPAMQGLARIFPNPDVEGFIACCVQMENIEAIWDYAKTRCVSGEMQDVPALAKLLVFCLSMHNLTFSPARIVQQVVNVGEPFDVEKHIRGHDSKPAGAIAAIDLPGYVNIQSGKILKKTVVRM